jgi:hypothetical protein
LILYGEVVLFDMEKGMMLHSTEKQMVLYGQLGQVYMEKSMVLYRKVDGALWTSRIGLYGEVNGAVQKSGWCFMEK